jgi:hypothetical protein
VSIPGFPQKISRTRTSAGGGAFPA